MRTSVKSIHGYQIDLEQIAGKNITFEKVVLVFENSDQMEFRWKDENEKAYFLKELDFEKS